MFEKTIGTNLKRGSSDEALVAVSAGVLFVQSLVSLPQTPLREPLPADGARQTLLTLTVLLQLGRPFKPFPALLAPTGRLHTSLVVVRVVPGRLYQVGAGERLPSLDIGGSTRVGVVLEEARQSLQAVQRADLSRIRRTMVLLSRLQ